MMAIALPSSCLRACRWILVVSLFFCIGSTKMLDAGVPIDNPKYDLKTTEGPDAATGGWFINLGITGVRARLLEEKPNELEVAYVFPDSPADGVVKVGDRIVSVDGKDFGNHKFGYGMDKFGYEGPLMDFGLALEKAQSSSEDGVLEIDFIRDKTLMSNSIKVGKEYGAYTASYPWGCRKSDKVLDELLEYLASEQKEDGTWGGRVHINTFAALALLASGDERYREHTRKAARAFAEATSDKIDYRAYDCWSHSLYAIYLAEYYLDTKEEWVLEELQELNRWMPKAQMANGGWGHRPANRPGGNGYGAINILTMQAKMAWALMKVCGIDIDEDGFRAAHEFTDRGTNDIGYVWYKDGVGGEGYADMGRTGAAALAHGLAPDEPGYRDFALRSARCIGTHPDTFSDTHGSPILGMAWTALGAAVDKDSFRSLMDENLWWFSLAQCPDGTFYYQPNRDNNPQDYTAAPRLSASAATALILSMRDRGLVIMNLDKGTVGPVEGKIMKKRPRPGQNGPRGVSANELLGASYSHCTGVTNPCKFSWKFTKDGFEIDAGEDPILPMLIEALAGRKQDADSIRGRWRVTDGELVLTGMSFDGVPNPGAFAALTIFNTGGGIIRITGDGGLPQFVFSRIR